MDRYKLANAIDKVRGYFLPKPHENTPEWRERAFRRAKNECLQALRNQIADIDALTWPQYQNSGKMGNFRDAKGALRSDTDLAEAAEGEICNACLRPSIECSRNPCPAVIEDRNS